MSDNLSRGEQAAEEVARRWISTMQTMADQIQRQQQTFQQMMQESMNSYIQLLNTPPFADRAKLRIRMLERGISLNDLSKRTRSKVCRKGAYRIMKGEVDRVQEDKLEAISRALSIPKEELIV